MKNWRKIAAAMMAFVMVLSMHTAAFAADGISVYVNGEKLVFDQEPIIKNGRTLVPMRGIFEALGADIEWNGAEKRVNADWGMNSLDLWIGGRNIEMGDGTTVMLDVPAQVINGRTLVPLRAVSQCMGANVVWDGSTKTINISSAAPEYIYENHKYTYSYKIPDGFYIAEEPPAGDGVIIQHVDDEIQIRVFASDFPEVMDYSLVELYEYYVINEFFEGNRHWCDYEYSFGGVVDLGEGIRLYQVSQVYGGTEYTISIRVPDYLLNEYEYLIVDPTENMIFG